MLYSVKEGVIQVKKLTEYGRDGLMIRFKHKKKTAKVIFVEIKNEDYIVDICHASDVKVVGTK